MRQNRYCAPGVTRLCSLKRFSDGSFETVRVHRAWFELERVRVTRGCEAQLRDGSPEPRYVSLKDFGGGGRWRLAPEASDEKLRRHGPTGAQRQHLDHGPLFRRGEFDRALSRSDFQRPQERDLHPANTRRPICAVLVGPQVGRARVSALVYRAYTTLYRAASRAQPSRQRLNNNDSRKEAAAKQTSPTTKGANE